MTLLRIVIIAIILIIMISLISSCSFFYESLSRIISIFNFNYPGLRFEIRSYEKSNDTKTIVCFGDSVTFGWNIKYVESYPALLDKKLSANDLKVLNLGIGGNTIIDAYSRIDRDLLKYEPVMVFINFGLNDGMLSEVQTSYSNSSMIYSYKSKKYAPNVDLIEFEKYYKKVADRILESGSELIIVGINPITDHYPADKEIEFRTKQKKIYKTYNEKIKAIAQDKNLSYIEIWEHFEEMDDFSFFMDDDGLHPNQHGSYIIFERIYEYIKESGKISLD